MQQHHGAAVRLRRSDVHIGHPHLFAVVDQRQHVDGVGIGKALEADAVGFARRGVGRCAQHSEQGDRLREASKAKHDARRIENSIERLAHRLIDATYARRKDFAGSRFGEDDMPQI